MLLRPPNSPVSTWAGSSSRGRRTCSALPCSTFCSSRPLPVPAVLLEVAWICLYHIPNIYLGGLAIPSRAPSGLKTPRSKKIRKRTRTRARGKGTSRWLNWAKSGLSSKSAHVMFGGSHILGDQKAAARDAISHLSPLYLRPGIEFILMHRAVISKSPVREYLDLYSLVIIRWLTGEYYHSSKPDGSWHLYKITAGWHATKSYFHLVFKGSSIAINFVARNHQCAPKKLYFCSIRPHVNFVQSCQDTPQQPF